LVLEWKGRLFPMEIKSSARPSAEDASGLKAFRAAHLKSEIGPGLIVAPTDAPYPIGKDAWVIPWDLAGWG
jgi:hypothetical protein